MASNTHIAELLKAEEEAQNTVTQARKGEGGPFSFLFSAPALSAAEPLLFR